MRENHTENYRNVGNEKHFNKVMYILHILYNTYIRYKMYKIYKIYRMVDLIKSMKNRLDFVLHFNRRYFFSIMAAKAAGSNFFKFTVG